MKRNIFTLNIIYTSMEDTVGLDTYVFDTMEKAMSKFETEEEKWLQEQKHRKTRIWGITEEEFEEWISKALDINAQHDGGLYKNYIYDDGDEKVFAIEKHEIDTDTLFVLTRESVFTNNQFEVDHSVEMITHDFNKAIDKAYALRDEAKKDMKNCINTEKLQGTNYEFIVTDPECGDRIYLKLEAMEVQ